MNIKLIKKQKMIMVILYLLELFFFKKTQELIIRAIEIITKISLRNR